MTVPFERTVCDCAECVSACQRPAHLIPGDFERITAQLVADGRASTADDARLYFRASPGAVVAYETGALARIGTITPRTVDGRCVFQQEGRCTIHAAAPFGCAYFDFHMSGPEGHARSAWGLRLIMATPAYTALRASLPT